jgi:chemotaxis response regulator CheB
MPREAIERGAVQSIVPIDRIAATILERVGSGDRA